MAFRRLASWFSSADKASNALTVTNIKAEDDSSDALTLASTTPPPPPPPPPPMDKNIAKYFVVIESIRTAFSVVATTAVHAGLDPHGRKNEPSVLVQHAAGILTEYVHALGSDTFLWKYERGQGPRMARILRRAIVRILSVELGVLPGPGGPSPWPLIQVAGAQAIAAAEAKASTWYRYGSLPGNDNRLHPIFSTHGYLLAFYLLACDRADRGAAIAALDNAVGQLGATVASVQEAGLTAHLYKEQIAEIAKKAIEAAAGVAKALPGP